jgi:Uncharacterized protein conserved in bacteria (DUF2130)
MEASEKPQLPLEAGREGTVRVLEDRIVLEALTIADRDTARVVRERAETGQPPAETVIKSIEIGARVLEREGTAAEVDYVKAEFAKHTAELAERLSRTLEGGSEQLADEIARTFGAGREGTVQHQIKEMLVKFAEVQRESLARQFSASDGSNPLADFKSGVVDALKQAEVRRHREGEESRKRIEALTREIVELKEREQADRRVAEAEEAGTRKGLDFEGDVYEAIARIASLRGDVATHTGAEQAEGGGKKGDVLVELGAAEGPASGRILFEVKDKKLSRNDAWRELNEGMAARAAAFAILVVAGEERLPARCEPLCEYEGNKLIVAVDREDPAGLSLEIAYRLAVARVAMARDAGLQVDALAVRDTAQEAISILKQAQAIRSSLTGIKTSSDKARSSLDELVESVRAKLERIDALVAEEAAATAEAD